MFRSVYLFPMAVSFVASGVVWRWLLNSATATAHRASTASSRPWGSDSCRTRGGPIPAWGMAAIALPADLAALRLRDGVVPPGFRGIPDELREAARWTAPRRWKLYRHVIFPQLSPVALSALIIVGHMSLKVFDLIMAITGCHLPDRGSGDLPVDRAHRERLREVRRHRHHPAAARRACSSCPYLIHIARAEKASR